MIEMIIYKKMQIRLHLSLFIFWCDVSKWSNILMVTSLTPNIKVSAWPKFEHHWEKMTCYTNACIENNSITFYNIKESRSAYISFFFCWTNASLSLPHTKRISSVSSYILLPNLFSVLSQFYMKDCQMWKHSVHWLLLPCKHLVCIFPLPGLYLSQS